MCSPCRQRLGFRSFSARWFCTIQRWCACFRDRTVPGNVAAARRRAAYGQIVLVRGTAVRARDCGHNHGNNGAIQAVISKFTPSS